MATRTMRRVLAGRYELFEPVGSGGMGEVLAARDRATGRDVAVKLLPASRRGDERSIARLIAEARMARDIDHPNVVRVLDEGDEQQPFIVMERLSGRTLRDRLDAGRMHEDDVRDLGRQILAGLGALHAEGIAHRDLKPSNVLEGSHGTWKVGDLGIASVLDAETTLSLPGEVLGSLPYVAPERLAGDGTTPASDIYAVGTLLYEALAGRPAFPTDEPAEVVAMRIREGRAVPVGEVRPGGDPGLMAAIERAMALDPTHRFPDADAFATALAHEDAGSTTRVLPPLEATTPLPEVSTGDDAGTRFTELRRRLAPTPTLLAIVAAIVLAALVVLGVLALTLGGPTSRSGGSGGSRSGAPASIATAPEAGDEGGAAGEENGGGSSDSNAGGNGKAEKDQGNEDKDKGEHGNGKGNANGH